MKKLLLATAITALSLSAAHAAPKVYGKLFVSTDYVDAKAVDKTTVNLANNTVKVVNEPANTVAQVNSNASRFGLKGEDELTPTLSAIYQIEWAVDATDGGALTNRNRFLGLKSTDLGAIKWGQFDTAVKEAQNKVDVMNDFLESPAKPAKSLDMKTVLAGEERVTNVIAYESPEIEGVPVKLVANLIMEENNHNSENGGALSVAYEQSGVYLAVAGTKKVVADYNALDTKDLHSDLIRVVAQLDLGQMSVVDGLMLGAMYQTSKPSDDHAVIDQEDAFFVSASYQLPVEGWKVFGQASKGTTSLNIKDADDLTRQQMGVGVGYAFSKNTNLYGYVAQQKLDTIAVDVAKMTGTGTLDAKINVLGLGLEHKF